MVDTAETVPLLPWDHIDACPAPVCLGTRPRQIQVVLFLLFEIFFVDFFPDRIEERALDGDWTGVGRVGVVGCTLIW